MFESKNERGGLVGINESRSNANPLFHLHVCSGNNSVVTCANNPHHALLVKEWNEGAKEVSLKAFWVCGGSGNSFVRLGNYCSIYFTNWKSH